MTRVASTAHAVPSLATTTASQYRQLTREVVHTYSSGTERYYANGIWQNGDPSCWYCNVGPAVGAAYLSKSEPAQRQVAIDSINQAISEYRQANGSFAGGSIPGAAFAIMVGLAYVQLESQLTAATRSSWQEALSGIADYMVSNHDSTWYANGNVDVSYAAAFYFAWRATGEQKYLEDYNGELAFVTAPPLPRWAGSGLVITQEPTLADGSDGRGYLTEGSPSGWDPEYSHLQLDYLSALYSASGDPRVLRLLNLILNQELTRVNPSTFMLDALGGTRKNETIPFTSAALPLLVLDGDRPDLAPLLPNAFTRLTSEYQESFRYTNHNFYRGVALWLAPVLLASANVPAVTPSESGSSGSSTGSSAPSGGASSPSKSSRGSSPHPGVAAPVAAPVSSPGEGPPIVSPGVLDAASLVQVPSLEVSRVEYAFAAPHTLARGLTASVSAPGSLPFAVFACTNACAISLRPLLVIHRGGEKGPVVVQRFLRSSHFTLRAGGELVSRVQVPRSVLAAARRGHSVLIRLILTLRSAGMPVQGRNGTFKILWR